MKTLSQDRRKYLIVEALRALPVEVDAHTQLALPAELGISKATFLKWINLPKGSNTDIPGVKLVYIAQRLGKTVEELCNDVPRVKPYMKELKDPDDIMARFGMTKKSGLRIAR